MAALGERPFDNAFVIMDEAHNFISRVTNGGIIAKSLYNMLMDAKDMKLVLLSGTPAINNPFEIGYLLNLVRGPILVHKIAFGKEVPSQDKINQWLKDSGLLQYLDTYQIRLDKGVFEFTLLPEHFIRTKLPFVEHRTSQSSPIGLQIQKCLKQMVFVWQKHPLL